MERWSGPGRALEVHLAEWGDADRTTTMLDAAIERVERLGLDGIEYEDAPRRLKVWHAFGTTYSAHEMTTRDGYGLDGATNAAAEVDPYSEAGRLQRASMTADNFRRREYDALSGPTYYVSELLADQVTALAAQMPPEPLFPTDMPSRDGFLVLERPLLVPDLHPETGLPDERIVVPVRALAWTTTRVPTADNLEDQTPDSGIVLLAYADAVSYDEIYLPSLQAVTGDRAEAARDGWGRYLIPLEFAPWRFGHPWREVVEGELSSLTAQTPAVSLERRWFLALTRLMWQDLVTHVADRPKRAALRRIERARFPGDGYVKVLHLRRWRREGATDATGTGPPLAYRLRVRAHPRRQHYASLGPARLPDGSWNPESHRLIWIEEHVRGPEHAPFVDGYDVTAVIR